MGKCFHNFELSQMAAGFGRLGHLLCGSLGYLVIAAFIWGGTAGPSWAQRGKIEPEASGRVVVKPLAVAQKYMVAAANPYAAKAGLEILRAGGSAVDAVIAVQLVLNLVEPQSSGLGGGAFLVRFDGGDGSVRSFDGRERAPLSARPNRFMRDGVPLPFPVAVNSGLSVGVPGVLAMLALVHDKYGVLPWAELFKPAIALSKKGFIVSARLHGLLLRSGPGRFSKEARRYFFSSRGEPRPVGFVLKNPQFAKTLTMIASKGPKVFYEGPIAREIVKAVAHAPNFKGDLSLDDLRGYDAVERPPVCVSYRGKRVCGMGPPSSGAHTIGQTLMLLDGFGLGAGFKNGVNAGPMHLICEAEKLAFADRNRYLADPDFVSVPSGLLDLKYMQSRRRLIKSNRSMGRAEPGSPLSVKGELRGNDMTIERAGTSHISVVDQNGNAVSMTASIEGAFGSGLWAAGFLLNNELTDFSFRPVDEKGRPIANRVQGGKRPRSSMSPTIILDENNKFFAALGSPGGSRIIPYVLKSIIALIDWGMDAQEAAALFNFGSRNHGLEIEKGHQAAWDGSELKQLGHNIRLDTMTSGLHIIVSRGGRLEGGADPRREGVALGDD